MISFKNEKFINDIRHRQKLKERKIREKFDAEKFTDEYIKPQIDRHIKYGDNNNYITFYKDYRMKSKDMALLKNYLKSIGLKVYRYNNWIHPSCDNLKIYW